MFKRPLSSVTSNRSRHWRITNRLRAIIVPLLPIIARSLANRYYDGVTFLDVRSQSFRRIKPLRIKHETVAQRNFRFAFISPGGHPRHSYRTWPIVDTEVNYRVAIAIFVLATHLQRVAIFLEPVFPGYSR